MLELKSKNEILDEIAKSIRRIRLEANWSQEDVANKTGMSLGTYINIESGKDYKVSNLISVLIVLGKVSIFEELVKEKQFSPKEATLKARSARVNNTSRKRAFSAKRNNSKTDFSNNNHPSNTKASTLLSRLKKSDKGRK